MRVVIFVWLLAQPLVGFSQKTSMWDTLNIQYQIVYQDYGPFYNTIKIMVPPFLTTAELMEQIRLMLFFPGTDPPKRKTYVYVFKETDPLGTESRTGCVYKPGKGFLWDLRDWYPDSTWLTAPSDREICIYNCYLDTLFKYGIPPLDSTTELEQKVARQFGITVSRLDSIYYKVKFWRDAQRTRRRFSDILEP